MIKRKNTNCFILIKRSLPAFSALMFCALQAHSQPQHNYQSPRFTDSNRLQAMSVAFPVIDSLCKAYALQNHYPGFAFGIVADGKLMHTAFYGFTDVSNKTPVTSGSMFRIASMTKSFTAMAILKLRDEGRLSLDDKAADYIQELKHNVYLTADAPPITIRHLLTHAAGLPEDDPWGDRQLADTDEELVALIQKGISFSNVPGVAYEYSNLAFAMLGHIISKVSGTPYQQYITQHLLQPLGMMNTGWEFAKVPPAKLAHGYRWLNDEWVEQPLLHDGSFGAMGGLITSIEEFSRYMALHLSGTPPSNDKETGPVKRSSLREMQQPWNINTLSPHYLFPGGRECATITAYGFGMRWMKDCDNRVYVGHSGGLPGFGSEWKILPEYGIGIVSFANLTYAGLSAVQPAVGGYIDLYGAIEAARAAGYLTF